MLSISSIGTDTGKPAADPSVVNRGASSWRDTSVEVPPISKLMKRSIPSVCATAAAPISPPAGPDKTVRAACAEASVTEIEPPLDWKTRSFVRGRAAARDSM